jgi:hypothetical protein
VQADDQTVVSPQQRVASRRTGHPIVDDEFVDGAGGGFGGRRQGRRLRAGDDRIGAMMGASRPRDGRRGRKDRDCRAQQQPITVFHLRLFAPYRVGKLPQMGTS